MDREELNKIAKVLYNKIYNENIKVYTELAKEGQEYYSYALEENRITIPMIEHAIMYNEDLNQLNDAPMQNYITTDLNAFFTKILVIREINLEYYVSVILECDIDAFIFVIKDILECFTEEESMPIKKAFLKRMLNGYDVEAINEENINSLFWPLLEEKIVQEDKRISRKLVQ